MRILNRIVTMSLIITLLLVNNLLVFAHSKILNVDYDDCLIPTNANGEIISTDGEDEMWYRIALYKRRRY